MMIRPIRVETPTATWLHLQADDGRLLAVLSLPPARPPARPWLACLLRILGITLHVA